MGKPRARPHPGVSGMRPLNSLSPHPDPPDDRRPWGPGAAGGVRPGAGAGPVAPNRTGRAEYGGSIAHVQKHTVAVCARWPCWRPWAPLGRRWAPCRRARRRRSRRHDDSAARSAGRAGLSSPPACPLRLLRAPETWLPSGSWPAIHFAISSPHPSGSSGWLRWRRGPRWEGLLTWGWAGWPRW